LILAMNSVRGAAQMSDAELFSLYRRTGDHHARELLAERFLPFARKLAQRYRYTREPIDDLTQVAALGLLRAIDRFDPARGYRFTSFAAPTILGELKRHFRDKGWATRVPRELQEHALALGRASERLTQDLGRPPTIPQLAETLGWTIESVIEAHEVARSYETASLDAPTTNESEDSVAPIDRLGHDDGGFELAESRDMIAQGWRELSDVERQIVSLRYAHDLTQSEIAHRVGCSQMQVSRLLRRSIDCLLSGEVS
jgi:RNA polymerase sigma-B factor